MNDPLSVFALLASASWPVLLIMLGLVIASVASWTMIVQRYLALTAVFNDLTEFEDHFWSGTDIREIYQELEESEELTGIEAIFVAGFGEYQRLSQTSPGDTSAIINGIQRATRVAVTREELALEKHLGFLATLGSTAPYVGLFGTVIGIINSFRSLANMSQATLASVAPGISEALLATAVGLFAAIPATIAFNRFSARVEVITKGYESFSDELISILMNVVGQRNP